MSGINNRKYIAENCKLEKESDENKSIDEKFQNLMLDPKFKKLAGRVFDQVAMHEVAQGNITHAEIENGKFIDKIALMFKEGDEFTSIIDHTDSILNRARRERSRLPEEAILHYALYIEHKINAIIWYLSRRKEIEHSAALGLMRELKLTSKVTWALQILKEKSFNQDTVKKIGQIAEQRNYYVHYKWNEVTDYDIRQTFLREMFVDAETVISTIREYENKTLYGGKRWRIRKMLSISKSNN